MPLDDDDEAAANLKTPLWALPARRASSTALASQCGANRERCCCCCCRRGWCCCCCWRGAKREEEDEVGVERLRCLDGIDGECEDGEGEGDDAECFHALSRKGTAFDTFLAAGVVVFCRAPPKPGGASSSSRGSWSPGDSGEDFGADVVDAAFASFEDVKLDDDGGDDEGFAADADPGLKCSLAQDHRPPIPPVAAAGAAAAGSAVGAGDAVPPGATFFLEEEPREAAAASLRSFDQRGLRSLAPVAAAGAGASCCCCRSSTAAACMARFRGKKKAGEGGVLSKVGPRGGGEL